MEIVRIDINKIKPYEKNAKIHTQEQIEQIKKSILEFGNNDPIGIWNNIIVEGHGRYEALKQLGYKEVECIKLDNLTDEQRRAYTLAHNQLTMNTDWDEDLLAIAMEDITEFDMADFGFLEEDEEVEPINDEEIENTQRIENVLKFGKVQVVMTDDEFDELNEKFDEYVDENGVSFGFVRWLLNGR